MACLKINISPSIQQNAILLYLISWKKSVGIPRICESIFSKLLTLEVGDIRPPLRIEVKLDLGILPWWLWGCQNLQRHPFSLIFDLLWFDGKIHNSRRWNSNKVCFDFRKEWIFVFKFTGTKMIKITQPYSLQ